MKIEAQDTSTIDKYRWRDYIRPVRMTVWTWRICGLYNAKPQTPLYRAYRIVFNVVLMVVYLFTLSFNMFVMQTFEQLVLYIMYIVFTEIVMVLKALIAYYKFDQICDLFRQTLDSDFQPVDDEEEKLYRKGVGEINYYFYLYITTTNLAIASSLLYLLHQDYRMPYFPWMLGIEYGSTERINFGIMFAYQVIGMYFHMLINIAIDVQLFYFLGMIGIQLDVLGKRFRKIRTSEEFGKSFMNLINLYQKLHRMTRDIEQLYSPAFFAQFSASGLVICATAYKTSSMFNVYELTAIQNLLYMLSMMFQMFLPCRFGNEVTRKSHLLRTSIYSSRWYEMGLYDRKTLHMLLQRMNKPLTLKAYYFFNYNLQAYTTTLNMAYSVYALLQRNALKKS
ncbi:odorant receptor 94b-like [Anopheles maculipalpis]|uniref:odorant receptor 94b-like n=1 Tax=Anopheles maculipalpis TaxID=1496333 RepID=UPI00215956F2|nr:odorant receptor 94b-like [Anopheles maculipalpis]